MIETDYILSNQEHLAFLEALTLCDSIRYPSSNHMYCMEKGIPTVPHPIVAKLQESTTKTSALNANVMS